MSLRDEWRERLAEVLAEAFDEWLFRMHGVTSSCRHEVEGQGLAEAAAPVVEQMLAEARAEALREAAEVMPFGYSHARALLIERADAAEREAR